MGTRKAGGGGLSKELPVKVNGGLAHHASMTGYDTWGLFVRALPAYRVQQVRLWIAYLALFLIARGSAWQGHHGVRSGFEAGLLGLTFPGAGFFNWASPAEPGLAFTLFLAGFSAFGLALFVWFATGNVVAPVATWSGLAVLAGFPASFGFHAGEPFKDWPWLIAPVVLAVSLVSWLKPAAPVSSRNQNGARWFAPPITHKAPRVELANEEQQRLRLLLDRALQPVERFDGFEWRDQFQTAALRYQINFLAYALAIAERRNAELSADCLNDAQWRLMFKIGDKRVWSYWRLENAWGNLSLSPDPIRRQNIMYSGFTLLQMALGGVDELRLHNAGTLWRSYSLDEIAESLARQYRVSRTGLLDCEPNWSYPLCNLITMAGSKAADARLGTDRWESLSEPFLAALEREGLRADGSFIAFRSTLTGIAPPSPGGIVMQAFPCLFLNALAPAIAEQQWHHVRKRLDHSSWRREFWPIDVGNYGFSRASSYAATAAAAVEMGDQAVADECLRLLDIECPACERAGAIHRRHASLWAHELEVIARFNRAGGFRDVISNPRKSRTSAARVHDRVSGILQSTPELAI